MTAHPIAVMRHAIILLSLAGSVVLAQSSQLPVARDAFKPQSAPTAPSNAPHIVQPARVFYSNGQLEIIANNSNLNQILRDVGLQTGIKITGVVADQPVYGRYGPDTPDKILTSLLDGTNCNMVLTAATSNAPAELLLTPREGGSSSADSMPVIASAQTTPQGAQPPVTPPPGMIGTPRTQTTGPTASQGLSSPSTAPVTPVPTGEERTTQQIYEHLLQLRALQHGSH